jgi:DNA-binding CsgD family transcriptional regulator
VPLARLLDAMDGAVLVTDAAGRLMHASPAFERLVGAACRALVGTPPPYPFWVRRQTRPLHPASVLGGSGQAGPSQEAVFSTELRHASGRRVPVRVTWDCLCDADGEPDAHFFFLEPAGRAALEGKDPARELRRVEESLRRIALEMQQMGLLPDPLTRGASSDAQAEVRALSRREWEVLRALLHGERVPIIARNLSISHNTVRSHLKSIFRKVGVRSQLELIERLRPSA